MSRYDELLKLKQDIDNAVVALTELLERYDSLELDLDKTKKATRKLVFVSDLSQEELDDLMDLYEDWEVGESVNVGDIRKYSNKLYRVIQAHTTQSDWTPDIVPALFTKVQPPEVIREIPDPVTAAEKFAKGEKGTWNGKVYESTIENNVWTPTAYPAGWKLIG